MLTDERLDAWLAGGESRLALDHLEWLVRDRPDGRQTHYHAQLAALAPLIDWTSRMTGFWQNKFDALEDLLKRMDPRLIKPNLSLSNANFPMRREKSGAR